MTAVGWLEGQKFLYDELDAVGEPVFPDRVAGVIEDLTLILSDGARLKLKAFLFHAQEEHPLHTGYPSSCFRETVRRYWPFTKIKQR